MFVSAFIYSQASTQKPLSKIRPHQIIFYIHNDVTSLSDLKHSLH